MDTKETKILSVDIYSNQGRTYIGITSEGKLKKSNYSGDCGCQARKNKAVAMLFRPQPIVYLIILSIR